MNTYATASADNHTARVTIALLNLGCGGGGSLEIERALGKMPGVQRAYVNPATEMAYIEFDPSRCDQDALVDTIHRLGYRTTDPIWR